MNFTDITIIEDFKDTECKGVYFNYNIRLYNKSSATLFHELRHHITKYILNFVYEHAKAEIQSEITAYILTKYFDQFAEFNFNYSNCWSNRLPEEYSIKDFESDFKKIENCINSLCFN